MADKDQTGINVEELYQKYAPMVLRRCRQLLKNEDHAVEAMQDVFVRLLVKKEQLHGQYPSSLLYRIATNVCLNIIRDRKPEAAGQEQELLNQIACAGDQETRTLAGVILDRLFRHEQPSTREIAVLHFVDGMTHQEVARQFKLSVSGVRKRLREFRTRVWNEQEK